VARKTGAGVSADLKIDYQLYETSYSKLTYLSSQLQDIQAQQAEYDGSMGSGDISGAMDNFAGNWSYHRNQLVNNISNLTQMVQKALTDFPKTDRGLARSLKAPGKG
jgi:hypothetical protein